MAGCPRCLGFGSARTDTDQVSLAPRTQSARRSEARDVARCVSSGILRPIGREPRNTRTTRKRSDHGFLGSTRIGEGTDRRRDCDRCSPLRKKRDQRQRPANPTADFSDGRGWRVSSEEVARARADVARSGRSGISRPIGCKLRNTRTTRNRSNHGFLGSTRMANSHERPTSDRY
jgi:hypothetical protein